MTAIQAEGHDIELRGIGRRFGPHTALADINLRLSAGRTVTLFGPNGAGKSTLLRLLSGGLQPTSGELLLGGQRLNTRAPGWRARLGVLSHETHLYPALTARENLSFFATLQGVARGAERIDEALEAVGLEGRTEEPVARFSRGMRQRLALARTLFHDPDIVLLDEPFTGLDAQASALLEGVLRRLRDGHRTVVLVTHALAEGLALADNVVILSRGRVVLEEEASQLSGGSFAERYRSVVEVPA